MLSEFPAGETYTAIYRFKWTSAGTKKFEVHVDPNLTIKDERQANT